MKRIKKGFTLVELVIVIAVIAILAAVLIPTISSVVGSAHKSAVNQEATHLRTEMLAIGNADLDDYCDSMLRKYWEKAFEGVLDEDDAPISVVEFPDCINSSKKVDTSKYNEVLNGADFNEEVKENLEAYFNTSIDEIAITIEGTEYVSFNEDDYDDEALTFNKAISDLEGKIIIGFKNVEGEDKAQAFVEYVSNGYKVTITEDKEIKIVKNKADA